MKPYIPNEDLRYRIYRIRGQQVMLDSDLAQLYGVPTGALNQAVKRNSDRFPDDFMFRLSRGEIVRISQTVISSVPQNQLKYFKSITVFTEQGIAMLSGVLRSPLAVQVNIAIMRAFVKLRHVLLSHQGIARRVEQLEGKVAVHETDIRFLMQDEEKLKKRPGPEGPITPIVL